MDERQKTLTRRKLVAGTGTAGALAAAAAVLPVSRPPVAEAAHRGPATESGGYQLTQHVLRYYQTTRI